MLAIPAFQARTQTALFRASNKPPLEVVVANLEAGENPDEYFKPVEPQRAAVYYFPNGLH